MRIICSSFLLFLFVVVLANSLVYAATPTNIPSDLQNLLKDPNTKVVVHDATYAATTIPTPSQVIAQNSPQNTSSVISVDSPVEGAVIQNESVIISGKGPVDMLITVNIYDDDFSNIFIKHQSSVHTLGTTTTDKDGNWVYSPAQKLALGRYQVWAYYNDPQKGTIQSNTVHFVVANVLGKTQDVYFWFSSQFWLLVIFVLIIVVVLIYLKYWRSKNKSQDKSLSGKSDLQGVKLPGTKKASNFLTPEEIKQLEEKQEEVHNDDRKKLAKLKDELKDVKETLATTARNVAVAGKETETIEHEMEEEIQETEKPLVDEQIYKLKNKKK